MGSGAIAGNAASPVDAAAQAAPAAGYEPPVSDSAQAEQANPAKINTSVTQAAASPEGKAIAEKSTDEASYVRDMTQLIKPELKTPEQQAAFQASPEGKALTERLGQEFQKIQGEKAANTPQASMEMPKESFGADGTLSDFVEMPKMQMQKMPLKKAIEEVLASLPVRQGMS